MTQTATMPALKEWSAVVHALLDGRQWVLLRKGGIGEKRFEVAAREFMLFPTVAHSHAERVRPEFQRLAHGCGSRQRRRARRGAGGGESRCGTAGQPAR